MVSFINSWAQGIILAVIVATIIEIILPDGNNKKYVKTIIGIYILFVIVYPLISKITNIDIDSITAVAEQEISTYENNNIELETNAYIENVYISNTEEDIKQKIKEKGYNINSLNLYIETEDSNRYGQINSMVMQITKDENIKNENENTNQVNEINSVEEIEIQIGNNNANDEKIISEITNEEVEDLKDYLNTAYSLEKEKIHINE